MLNLPPLSSIVNVALLAEGVDRNIQKNEIGKISVRSPSSRRAWIEIVLAFDRADGLSVALLAEGVDRNGFQKSDGLKLPGRPPRGGRG